MSSNFLHFLHKASPVPELMPEVYFEFVLGIKVGAKWRVSGSIRWMRWYYNLALTFIKQHTNDSWSKVICGCWSRILSSIKPLQSLAGDFGTFFDSADNVYEDSDFIFQQVLAAPCTASSTNTWFKDSVITVIDSSALPLDLNYRESIKLTRRCLINTWFRHSSKKTSEQILSV